MGSKRPKRSKVELDVSNEKVAVKGDTSHASNSVVYADSSNHVQSSSSSPKAPKRRQKSVNGEIPPKRAKKGGDDTAKKTLKKKVKKAPVQQAVVESINDIPSSPVVNGDLKPMNNKITLADIPLPWPTEDIMVLIDRIETNLPENDSLAFRSRIEKLNWNNVMFKTYTALECKQTWMYVQKRIRRFRLLREMLDDARTWLTSPKNAKKNAKAKRHPDMPRRPLSAYLLFFLRQKSDVMREHPELDTNDLTRMMGQLYKNLAPEIKSQYEREAALNKEDYQRKLKFFFEQHPDLAPPQRKYRSPKSTKSSDSLSTSEASTILAASSNSSENGLPISPPVGAGVALPFHQSTPEKITPKTSNVVVSPPKSPNQRPKSSKAKNDANTGHGSRARNTLTQTKRAIGKFHKERLPKKNLSAFGHYVAAAGENCDTGVEKGALRDKCKTLYKSLTDMEKLQWINIAEQDFRRYEEEIRGYKSRNPGVLVESIKPALTKNERLIKERASGKPVKPPTSAYALYSRGLLKSNEIKLIPAKERMNTIANRWKNCSEEEQKLFKDQVSQLHEEYKSQFAVYLLSLPEDQREQAITESERRPGRKAGSKLSTSNTRKRSTPSRKPRAPKKEPQSKKPQKFAEPEQPPITACKFFAMQYKGDGDPVQVWKSLKTSEKQIYQEELVKKKKAYIVEFEKFLNSLSQDELQAFSLSRQQGNPDEESSDCTSGDEGEDFDDDENEQNQSDSE